MSLPDFLVHDVYCNKQLKLWTRLKSIFRFNVFGFIFQQRNLSFQNLSCLIQGATSLEVRLICECLPYFDLLSIYFEFVLGSAKPVPVPTTASQQVPVISCANSESEQTVFSLARVV